MPVPLAYKTRLVYAVWVASFVSVPLLIGYLFSAVQLGPFRWAFLAPSLAGLLLPLVWPVCPHCHSGVIWPKRNWRFYRNPLSIAPSEREDVTWLWPPRYCQTCHQELDGPFRTKEEFGAHIDEERRRRLEDLEVGARVDQIERPPSPPGTRDGTA